MNLLNSYSATWTANVWPPLRTLGRFLISILLFLVFLISTVEADELRKPTAEGDALVQAIEKGQEDTVEQLLLQKTSIDSRGKKYPSWSPLKIAIWSGKKTIVEILIKHGANVRETGNLCFALPHTKILELLIDSGADINSDRCTSGEAPLEAAINLGHPESADILIAHGATKLDEYVNHGRPIGLGKRTPLQEAARHGKFQAVKWLIEHGADVNKVSGGGLAPIYDAAAGTADVRIFDLLLKHGATLAETEISKISPLVCYGNFDFLVFLESHGLAPDFDACYKELARRPPKDDRILGWLTSRRKITNLMVREDSLLHIAVENINVVIAKLLLDAGADPNTRGKHGAPPLARAISEWPSRQGEYKPIVDLLLSRGADPNLRDRDRGITLLMKISLAKTISASKEKAWEKYCLELADFAKALILAGADVNATNADGDTAMHFAAATNNFLMIQHLAAHGADLKAVTKEGKTPLVAAFGPGSSIDGRSLATISKIVELERSAGIQQDWPKLTAAANLRIYDVREKQQVLSLLKHLEDNPAESFRVGNQEEAIAKIIDESPKTPKERLQSCKKEIALAAAYEIINDPSSLKEPLDLFGPAGVLLHFGKKDDAVFWFYAAQLRSRYQLVFERGDRGQLLAIMMGTVGASINEYAFQDITKLNQILDKVLDWDKKSPNPYRDKTKTEAMEIQIERIYSGIGDLKAKIVAEKNNLEREARLSAPRQQALEARFADGCRK